MLRFVSFCFFVASLLLCCRSYCFFLSAGCVFSFVLIACFFERAFFMLRAFYFFFDFLLYCCFACLFSSFFFKKKKVLGVCFPCLLCGSSDCVFSRLLCLLFVCFHCSCFLFASQSGGPGVWWSSRRRECLARLPPSLRDWNIIPSSKICSTVRTMMSSLDHLSSFRRDLRHGTPERSLPKIVALANR